MGDDDSGLPLHLCYARNHQRLLAAVARDVHP